MEKLGFLGVELQINPKSAPKLQWIQGTVLQGIQMMLAADVLFSIPDEKYARV